MIGEIKQESYREKTASPFSSLSGEVKKILSRKSREITGRKLEYLTVRTNFLVE